MTAPRDQIFRLQDILQAIGDIRTLLEDVGPEAYPPDRLRKLAVERGLEIISEASRHVSHDLQAQEPEIDWRGIADIGNVLRHAYNKVDDAVIYKIASSQLDEREAAARRFLAQLDA